MKNAWFWWTVHRTNCISFRQYHHEFPSSRDNKEGFYLCGQMLYLRFGYPHKRVRPVAELFWIITWRSLEDSEGIEAYKQRMYVWSKDHSQFLSQEPLGHLGLNVINLRGLFDFDTTPDIFNDNLVWSLCRPGEFWNTLFLFQSIDLSRGVRWHNRLEKFQLLIYKNFDNNRP